MTRFKWLALAPVLPVLTAVSFAADRDVLVGSWRLASFEREYQTTGEREYPMGNTPTGYIIFLTEGRMAVVITGEGRKAPTTDQDRAGLFNSLVAYTGSYRLDGDRWITTVDVSANPAWVGTEQSRAFRVTGDRLQEMTTWAARPDNHARHVDSIAEHDALLSTWPVGGVVPYLARSYVITARAIRLICITSCSC